MEALNYELKLLNLSKDKFLSVISHDLQNPLTALLVSSDLLMSGTEDETFNEIRPLVEIIDRTSHNILGQLNELVAWAKMQQNKIILKPEKIHLFTSLDKFLESLKNIAVQKSVSVENNIPDDINVTADNLMLKSILQNLVANAIKYTNENGVVTITAKVKEQMAEICIADSGSGMNAIGKKLFTEFKALAFSETDIKNDTSFGLILVKDFVAQNGGRISVKSSAGQGTMIFFTLPVG